jgi:hypothetical protein
MLIEGSGTNARPPSPFSRGRRTGRGDEIAKFTRRYFLSTALHGMTSLRSALGLLFLGERLGGRRRALFVAETLVPAGTVGPGSLLQREKDPCLRRNRQEEGME